MRKKVLAAVQLTSWAEVDDALRQIGENQRDVLAVENVMNEQIAAAKSSAEAKARPIRENTAMLEIAIREFALANRADMGKLKTKALNFGKVSFRKSSRVSLPTAAAKVAAIIEQLRERKMTECIISPPAKIDKEALKKYSADEIAAIGGTLKVEDVFGYEIASEKIEG